MTLKDESPRLEGIQYAAGKEQRTTTNSSGKNEMAGQSRNDPQFWMCLVMKVNPMLKRRVFHRNLEC